jgi:hypothetical protein
MLLRPFEHVLAELARVVRRHGLVAAVLPGASPDDSPNPISVFRAAWQEVNATFGVPIPSMQDDRALDAESLAMALTNAGFLSTSVRSFAVMKPMTPDAAAGCLLLTYLPDLLPEVGLNQLRQKLEAGLAELAGDDGTVTFVQHSLLVSARRG